MPAKPQNVRAAVERAQLVVEDLLGFSVGEPIPPLQLVHLTQLLLTRQRG